MIPIIQDILYFHMLITFVYDLVTSALSNRVDTQLALPSVIFGRLLLILLFSTFGGVKKLGMGIELLIEQLQCIPPAQKKGATPMYLLPHAKR